MGWYVWELMIGKSLWSDIHGIVYPDGTVRDPGIAAAVQGFFRRRTGKRVPYAIDKEGAVRAALEKAKKWQADPKAPYADGLAALESMANQMEAGEIVPMNEPPSIRVLELAADAAANRLEVARLLTAWAKVLEPFVLKK